LEAGRLGGLEAGRLGSFEAGRQLKPGGSKASRLETVRL
jgi:hypothetical protein